jgi:hypothetical protein
MFRMTRTIVALGSAAVLAAGTTAALASQATTQGTTSSSAADAVAGPAVAGCQPQALSAGLHGRVGAGGHTGFFLTLTNTSNDPCIVDGYTGLGLQNAAHHVLPSTTYWGSTYFDHDPGPRRIVLSPGETASADLAFDYGGGPPSDVVATYLEVTPPNDTQYLTVRFPRAPQYISQGDLEVTAMARHTP